MCADCRALATANAARFRDWYARAKMNRSPSYLRHVERTRRAYKPVRESRQMKQARAAIRASAERRRA